MRQFDMMSCIFRDRHNHLATSIGISRGRRSTLDLSCWPVLDGASALYSVSAFPRPCPLVSHCTSSCFPYLDGASTFPRVLSPFVSHCVLRSCLLLSPFVSRLPVAGAGGRWPVPDAGCRMPVACGCRCRPVAGGRCRMPDAGAGG